MAEEMKERWMLRLATYRKSLARLTEVIDLSHERTLNEYERDALIQRYEFTYEMGWKLMMSYEKENGLEQIRGSKDIIREAFRFGLIDNADVWFEMIEVRNKTVHNYDEEMADQSVDRIVYTFHPAMLELEKKAMLLEEETRRNACTD